jgi:hypothetical protein
MTNAYGAIDIVVNMATPRSTPRGVLLPTIRSVHK